ncbi:replication protein [Providencia rettgeri]|uniref:replication protein n=1 Tax=Providencia rettgeri TaxID=587 RepID=UPI003D2DC123
MNTAVDNVYKFPCYKQETQPVNQERARMADLDNGYLRIANEIQDALCQLQLAGREWQVLNAIIRLTWGWQKKEDRIQNILIEEKTKLGRNPVSESVGVLEVRGIIHVRRIGQNRYISINKNVSEWVYTKTRKTIPENRDNHPRKRVVVSPKKGITKDIISNTVKDINNSSSENSNESSDRPSEKVLAVKPDAVVSSPKGNKWGNADDLKAAQWIYSQVLIVSPATNEPNWAAWANDVRLMRQLDGRTHQDICRMFKWANKDSFWCSNVLSPAKLREKWPTLVIQSQQPNRNQRAAEQAPSQSWNTREAWENEFI